jgi:hypothetical protein
MELGAWYQNCAKALKPGRKILTTLTKAVDSGTGAVVPAGMPVFLVVREVDVSDTAIDSTRIAIDVDYLALSEKLYPLLADVVEMELKPSSGGHDVCIPKDGRILIKLRDSLTLEP